MRARAKRPRLPGVALARTVFSTFCVLSYLPANWHRNKRLCMRPSFLQSWVCILVQFDCITLLPAMSVFYKIFEKLSLLGPNRVHAKYDSRIFPKSHTHLVFRIQSKKGWGPTKNWKGPKKKGWGPPKKAAHLNWLPRLKHSIEITYLSIEFK